MVRRRRRANWVFRGLLLALLLLAAGYVVAAAWLQALVSPYAFRELLLPRLVDCLALAWLFWIGSAIGSFLNVVAWRMPRGRSINGLSHCPRCGHRLAARDNWPVFGWIALRGRCRTCRLPISPRYPIVELAVGLTLTAVGLVEIYGGLGNLPFLGAHRGPQGPMAMPLVTRETVGVWLYHTVAVACSWALGLVRFDDQRLPTRLVGWILAMVLLPMLAWPLLMIVPWQATVPDVWPSSSRLDALMRVVTGAVAATLVARALARYVCPTANLRLDPTGRGSRRLVDLVILMMVPAAVVGWQAALGVTLLATGIAAMMMRWLGLGRDGLAWLAVSLPVALTIQIVLWRPLEMTGVWPAASAAPVVILVAAASVLILPVALRTDDARRDTDPGSDAPSEESD